MSQRPRLPNGRFVLLIDGGGLALSCVPRDAGPARVVAVHDFATGDDAAAAGNLAARALALLQEHGVRDVALGVPGSWTEHLVLDVPPLRGVDRAGMLLREVTRVTRLPQDDLLFAEAPDGPRRRDGGKAPVLVVAAKESSVLGLVETLRDAGVRVAAATSGPAALVVRLLRETYGAGCTGDQTPAEALVHLRRDGFAIALHEGRRIHQFRLVTVELPDDVDDLAQVLAEEVRRSCMFFRERSKGRDVARVRIVGCVTTGGEGGEDGGGSTATAPACADVTPRLARLTGIETVTAGPRGEAADRQLEAAAIARLHDREGRGDLELLPVELGRARARVGSATLTALMLAAGVALVFLGASKLEAQQGRQHDAMVRLESLEPMLASMEQRHDVLSERVDRHLAACAAFDLMRDGRRDLALVLTRIAAAIPPRLHLRSVRASEHLAGPATLPGDLRVAIEGRADADPWTVDEHVAGFARALESSLGCAARAGRDVARAPGERDALAPFTLDLWWRESVTDESP